MNLKSYTKMCSKIKQLSLCVNIQVKDDSQTPMEMLINGDQ